MADLKAKRNSDLKNRIRLSSSILISNEEKLLEMSNKLNLPKSKVLDLCVEEYYKIFNKK
ncbi:CopG family transcriptional regulator [Romboutsia sp. 1001713B170131_170501_G6]|uniref:CopG family transcriptional regulator n=1 Tax=Romboutsia sp. 1001713B170131_170501_G6 TaxID=2787108 RepID=UPI0018ABFC4A|nr:CopG family transcriptional regulator [Romboutsia sp. 1001713B170131_170501_G6]